MKLDITAQAQLSAVLDAEADRIAQTAKKTVEATAAKLRAELADETASALGTALARAWNVRNYGRASLVYSKAPRIVEAFTADTVITARGAQWLVLPLDAAKARGFDRIKRRHASNLDAAIGALGPLAFVPLAGNRALLVRRDRAGKPVPFFLLIKRVTLAKRLDIAGPAERARDTLRNTMVAA